MTERPIIFSGDMVRAILAGSKTQTRRPVKPQPLEHPACVWRGGEVVLSSGLGPAEYCRDTVCPFGVPGDRLWVRESIRAVHDDTRTGWVYLADGSFKCGTEAVNERGGSSLLLAASAAGRTIPSIHMPRFATRLTLEVVAVRVERVSSISLPDCIAEGWIPKPELSTDIDVHTDAARDWFSDWWQSGYPSSWERNDWVWAIEFRRLP